MYHKAKRNLRSMTLYLYIYGKHFFIQTRKHPLAEVLALLVGKSCFARISSPGASQDLPALCPTRCACTSVLILLSAGLQYQIQVH